MTGRGPLLMVYAVLWKFIEANYSAQETRGWLLRSGEYEYWDPEAQQHVAFLCLIREIHTVAYAISQNPVLALLVVFEREKKGTPKLPLL
jgi:hypothetical protein